MLLTLDIGNTNITFGVFDETGGAPMRWGAGGSVPGDFGDGGPAIAAGLNRPTGLRFYGADVLLVCDSLNNRIRGVRLL